MDAFLTCEIIIFDFIFPFLLYFLMDSASSLSVDFKGGFFIICADLSG